LNEKDASLANLKSIQKRFKNEKEICIYV